MNRNSKFIILVAVLASLLEIIDTSIVNVAIPTMMGNLGATLEDISWVVTGYIIANAIVLPLSAWLGDRIGRRKYYIGCILAFTAISVFCGLAPNLFTLTVFRVLQGLAGGALLPTSQTLIYEQFPKEKAGIAGAIFGMSVMIGPTLGPTLGGYLTDNFGWRMIFNINLPLGLLAAFLAYMYVEEPAKNLAHEKNKVKAPIDTIGLLLLCLGIGCMQYVLERGESDDWFSSAAIVINTLIATFSIPGFVWWELRVKDPIINVRLFLEPIVVNGVLLMSFLGFFLYGIIFILPIFVSRIFHYDATQTGMLFIPGSLLTAAVMPFVGKSMEKISVKFLIFIGLVSIEIFLIYMSGFSSQTSYNNLIFALFIRGFGMAFLFVPINSSILSQFKGPYLGQVSGLMNLFRQIGGSIGIALIATLLSSRSHQNYLDVVSNVTLLKSSTQSAYYGSVQALSQKMPGALGTATGHEAAIRALSMRVGNQVFMMSFAQLMIIIAIIFTFSFYPLYKLRLKVKPRGDIAAH